MTGVGVVVMAAACGHFQHDHARNLARVRTIVGHAREAGVRLLALPHATFDDLAPDDPVFAVVRALAGEMVVCLGYTERVGGRRFGTAVCLDGDGELGRHRQLHLTPEEAVALTPGDRLAAFDTPVGRIGLLVDHDKTFPEAARALALDGAGVLAVLSAWPASATGRAATLVHDRQTHLFDLYDRARAAENQVVVLSSNQSGGLGPRRFVGSAKIVGPGGEVLAGTGVRGGLALAAIDVDFELEQARRPSGHLDQLRPEVYPR